MDGDVKINIGLTTKVYSQKDIDSVLNRKFKQFGQSEEVTEKTVDQFFVDYENLFYQIPVEGTVNSHEYLVKKSSELYRIDTSTESIQPLLDEITLLRSQSVVDQQTIIDLRTQLASTGVAEADTDTVSSLRIELAKAIDESNQ